MKSKSTDDKKCNRYYKAKRTPSYIPEFYQVIRGRKQDTLKFISGDYRLQVCDKLTGFYLKDFAKEIKPWAIKTIEYYRDASN